MSSETPSPPLDAAPADVHLTLFSYGGVEGDTMDSVVRELFHAQSKGVLVSYSRTGDDALISRSRSFAASRFLETGSPVMVMVDHDIAFQPGDVLEIARLAVEKNALVAGLYPCRAYGAGLASRLKADGVAFTVGGDALHEAEYVATGFLAIPRSTLLKVKNRLTPADVHAEFRESLVVRKCAGLNGPGSAPFYDFFRCFSRGATHPSANAEFEYLSEDWAFCARAAAVGVKSYIAEKPILQHFGKHGFTIAEIGERR